MKLDAKSTIEAGKAILGIELGSTRIKAVLMVNVIAKILYGLIPHSSIRYAMRFVKTRVFPEPAPAIINTGPSVCFTALFWQSFNPSKFKPFLHSCVYTVSL